jgi:hypothetical protein
LPVPTLCRCAPKGNRRRRAGRDCTDARRLIETNTQLSARFRRRFRGNFTVIIAHRHLRHGTALPVELAGKWGATA